MGSPWVPLGVPLGSFFATFFLFRDALDLKMNAFSGDLFLDTLFSRFWGILFVPWTQKPWISRGTGSKNHTLARIGIFTVLVPMWGSF